MDDGIMEDAILYLEERQYRDDCPPNRKRAIRKKCQKFKIDDSGEILYEKKPGQVSNLSTYDDSLILSCHNHHVI